MKPNKILFCLSLVTGCLGGSTAFAQTHVQVPLNAIVGQSGITTTNRACLVQYLSGPGVNASAVVINDKGKFVSDGNSSFTISNCAVGTYGVTVQAPPSRAYFEFTVTNVNEGLVSVIPKITVTGANTYPAAAATAYTMAASDARYALSTNALGSAAMQPASSFQPASANLTNWANVSPGQYVLASAIGTAASSNANAFQAASANLTSWSAYSPAQYVLASLVGTAASSNASAFQAASAVLSNWAMLNTNLVVFQSQIGTAALSNANAFQLASANLSGWSVIPTNAVVYPGQLGTAAYLASTAFQAASANLTSWAAYVPSQYVLASTLGTAAVANASAFQPASANLTNWAATLPSAVVYQTQIGTAASSNASAFQAASAVLSNWAMLNTNLVVYQTQIGSAAASNAAAFQPANANLTNWAAVNTNVLGNLITGGQAGSAALTNLALNNGGALTNLNAAAIAGIVPTGELPTAIVYTNSGSGFVLHHWFTAKNGFFYGSPNQMSYNDSLNAVDWFVAGSPQEAVPANVSTDYGINFTSMNAWSRGNWGINISTTNSTKFGSRPTLTNAQGVVIGYYPAGYFGAENEQGLTDNLAGVVNVTANALPVATSVTFDALGLGAKNYPGWYEDVAGKMAGVPLWYANTFIDISNNVFNGVPLPKWALAVNPTNGTVTASNFVGNLSVTNLTGVVATNNLPAALAALNQGNGGALTNLAGGATLAAPVIIGLPQWPGILPTISGVAQFVGYNGTNIYPITGPTFNPTNGFTGNGKGLTNIPLSALSLNTNLFVNTNDNRTLTLGNIYSTFTGFLTGVHTGNGAYLTNIPTSAIVDLNTNLFALTSALGTAAFSSTNQFYPANNPSNYLTAINTSGLVSNLSGMATNLTLSGTNILGGLNRFPMWGNTTLANGINSATSFGTNNAVRFTGPTAAFSSAGFAGGTNGAWFWAINATPQPWTILNDSGSDSVGNRIWTGTGANLTLSNQYSIGLFVYDQTSLHWVLSSASGQTVFNGVANGKFNGDGSGLTNLTVTGGWSVNGNSGLSATNKLGTMDNTPLSFVVNQLPAIQFTTTFIPSVVTVVVNPSHNTDVYSFAGDSIMGGSANTITNSSFGNTIAGGWNNLITGAPSVSFGTISGGNAVSVTGDYGVVPGGYANVATNSSFAAGRQALATHSLSFVWSDGMNGTNFTTTSPNQFLVHAYNGVGINTNNPGTNALSVNGMVSGSYLSTDSFARLKNNVTGPTGAQLGVNGSAFWSSNGIVYCSISTDGSTIATVKQIAP